MADATRDAEWKVRPAYAADGVTRTMEVAVTLRKAEPASWVDLIKTWYT